jgi:uncharacterized repeat protein (TIGR01451 family)
MNVKYLLSSIFALATLFFPRIAVAGSQMPFNPYPSNLATNVPANTNLSWNNFIELVSNGGFEAGTFTNWITTNMSSSGGWVVTNGTYDPPGPELPTPPYSGNFSAISEQSGPSTSTLYQDIAIPSSSNPVTLSWVDQIDNHATQYSSSQYFDVEIRRTNNTVLQVAFSTQPGNPLINGWTPRSFDLSSYAGQTVRLAFVESVNIGYLNVGLDNVSVRMLGVATNSTGVVTNDVYFGANPTPGPAEYQGSTTNTSWTLPLLTPQTIYYWQIAAHQGDTNIGPVWQFTTPGVDHLAWSAIYSPQTVYQAFSSTIIAQDAFNTTVTNFSGPVALTCFINGNTNAFQPISPTMSDTFTNGVWSGSIAVEDQVTDIVMQADDGNGHSGTSNPFDVNPADDLSINIVTAPNPSPFGTNLTYTLSIANTGPSDATGVMVTNWLPANISFVSATASQGTWLQANGVVTASLGLIPGGTNATLTIVVTPTNIGITLTNTASTSRAETDAYFGNNMATALTQVPLPSISITDSSCLEGNAGITNIIFVVSMSMPSPQAVLVNYATANGTAIAGSNYVATSGELTFAPGTTTQSIAVGVIGNKTVEPNKTFFVNLSTPTNGTLSRTQAIGTIINDDGIPGQAHHFVWTSIPSPQMVGYPFTTALTAFDFLNHVATNFNGTVSLSSLLTNHVGTNMDFETGTYPPWVTLNGGGPYGLTAFDITGNGVVSIAFGLDAQGGPPEGVVQNISLRGGMTYTVDVDIASHVYGPANLDGGTSSIVIGTNIIARHSFGEIHTDSTLFSHLHGTYTPPTNGVYPVSLMAARGYLDGGVWDFFDNVQIVGPALFGTLAINPTVSGNFTNGLWSGALTLLNRATNTVLIADDGNADFGYSNPLNIYPSNMPPVVLTQSPSQTNYVFGSVAFAVTSDGTPPISYQWNFNGTNLLGATNSLLTLANIQYNQAGVYFVLLSNAYGTAPSSNVSVTVASHPPVASPDTIPFTLGTLQLTFNVLNNDSDPDGDPLTVQSFTLPSRGALTQVSNGNFTYQPYATFTGGLDQFNYTITDGHSNFVTTAVTLNAASHYLNGGDWTTFGDGPSHTGYYPGALAGATLVPGWSRSLNISPWGLNQVCVGGGNVYVTPSYATNFLIALNAFSGQNAWFDPVGYGNAPTFNSGNVYVQDPNLWSFNAGNGSTNWTMGIASQGAAYQAPTVVGSNIWVQGGKFSGMYGFNTNGTELFFYNGLQQYDGWTPSWYQGVVYTWVGAQFRAHDPLTGNVLWMLTFPHPFPNDATVSAIDGGRAFVETQTNLIAIDLSAQTNVWMVNTNLKGSATIAKGIVYAIIGDSVEAFSGQDGTSLGLYEATNDLAIDYQAIVTDDSLFVASSSSTYIFDLASHELIQTISYGGKLSIANGWLYIAGPDGWLRAYYTVNFSAFDHFVWNPISSPQFVNTPFAVTIQAQNASNNVVTNFNGSVTINEITDIPITPTVSDNFTNGTWTGAVSISQPATNSILRASAGSGQFGLANPVGVFSLPALTILPSTTNFLIGWPTNPSGFVLEMSPNLSPGSWVPITASPVQVGNQYQYLEPIDSSGSNAFYRLQFMGH